MWPLLVACTPDNADPDDGGAHTAEPPVTGSPTADTASSTTTPEHTGSVSVDVEPPLGGTSGGDGGADHPRPVDQAAGSGEYVLLAPAGSDAGTRLPLLIVYSGVEGADLMMANLVSLAPLLGLRDAVVVVLDGRTSDAADGAAAIDAVRAAYDIDNDHTWLLSESAGTSAGLELGLSLRQSTFAAYWANDVNTRRAPDADASALGFAPWGNAGPGGAFADADAIVGGMADAGYRLPPDAPYSGPGSGQHGATEQFIAAVSFFEGLGR